MRYIKNSEVDVTINVSPKIQLTAEAAQDRLRRHIDFSSAHK
ncbi:MAG: hypothetical protein JWO91_2661 [Acidobacteriaceae bacterium]|nr:hypothetical protein [Acidobacteriaceae bacterium]